MRVSIIIPCLFLVKPLLCLLISRMSKLGRNGHFAAVLAAVLSFLILFAYRVISFCLFIFLAK